MAQSRMVTQGEYTEYQTFRCCAIIVTVPGASTLLFSQIVRSNSFYNSGFADKSQLVRNHLPRQGLLDERQHGEESSHDHHDRQEH